MLLLSKIFTLQFLQVDTFFLLILISQGKNARERKTARNQKQAKKGKVETESRSIKEMFTRASRRRN